METLFFQSHHGTNPFEDEPLPPAHYHPSLHKQLSENEKQTKLSPTRLPKNVAISSSSTRAKPVETSSPAEREFLRKRNTMLAKELPTHDTPSPGNTSSKFDESWPTSERPSTIESPGEYQAPALSTQMQRNEINTVPGASRNALSSSSSTGTDYLAQWRNRYNKPGTGEQQSMPVPAEGSTLAKYIQRFRYSEPKSRQERQEDKRANAARKDFWWLSPPSRTSTPSDIGDLTSASSRDATQVPPRSGRGRGGRVEGPGRREGYLGRVASSSTASTTEGGRARVEGPGRREGYLGRLASTSSASTPDGILDTETEELQSRAEKLLERSESTILSEPAVSSEGLGFSPGSSDHQEPKSVPREAPRPSPYTESHSQVPMGSGHQGAPRKALRPEEDILQQWRVRRRLEEARKQTMRPGLQRDALQYEKPAFEGTRLGEFRNRLKQQEHFCQIEPGNRQANPSKPLTQTLGTDPMPQTIATQTNGAPPSGVDDSPVRDGDIFEGPGDLPRRLLEGSVQREPVRPHVHNLQDVYRRTGRDVDHQLNYEYANEAEMDKPIIASPSIKKTNQTVPPHLHMACDIIPCRQDSIWVGHRHGDVVKQSEESASDKWSKSKQQNLSFDGRASSTATQDVTSSHPTTSREDSRSTDDDPIHLKTKMPRPATHRLSSQTLSGHTVATAKDIIREDPQAHERESSRERTRQRLDFEEEEEEEEAMRDGDEMRQSEDDTLRVTADEDIKASMKRTSLGRDAAETQDPITSLLGTAVGQVISDRLFTTPKNLAASPEWSPDSLPSMHSSLQSHGSRVSAADQGHVGGDEVIAGSFSSSDGEEFAEDELMQLLRRRRAQHENQLQELDHLILARTSVT